MLGAAALASLGFDPRTGQRLRSEDIYSEPPKRSPERLAAAEAKRARKLAKARRDAGWSEDIDVSVEL